MVENKIYLEQNIMDDGRFLAMTVMGQDKSISIRITKHNIDMVEHKDISGVSDVNKCCVEYLLEKLPLQENNRSFHIHSNMIAKLTRRGLGNTLVINPNNTLKEMYEYVCNMVEYKIVYSDAMPIDEGILLYKGTLSEDVDGGIFVINNNDKKYMLLNPMSDDSDNSPLDYFRRFKNPSDDNVKLFFACE